MEKLEEDHGEVASAHSFLLLSLNLHAVSAFTMCLPLGGMWVAVKI